MKRILACVLILSLAVLSAGCTAPGKEPTSSPSGGEASPSPSVNPSEEPLPTIPPRERLFDADGNVIIINEYGHIDHEAFWAIYMELTTEELAKIAPHTDGALAQSTVGQLAERLLEDPEGTAALMAPYEKPEERASTMAWHVGYVIWLDWQSEILTEEECKIIYAEYDLTAPEQAVLDKVIEGFEYAQTDHNET